ncbi:MAG: UvrD-helicase domain-containing protein [Phycisphaerales bacterium]|nr:UvrD-helicase domain-containing protein [Phycisphaerales bacterium]
MSHDCTLITANAGCGKTWTLANRCIGWMVAQRRATGHAQPSGLVAATFTRKAAGEILHRLLAHLSQASLEPSSIDLFKEGFGLDPVPTQDELLGVLEDVVATLHRLQFGTLDGFYHRIAATFAGEINMPSGWTIGDEPTLAAIQIQSFDELLSQCDDEMIETLVLQAERDIIKSQVHENILPTIFGKAHGGGLLSLWRQTLLDCGDDRAWRFLLELPADSISPGASRLADDRILEACHSITRAPLPLTKKEVEDKRWDTARQKLLDAVSNRQWQAVLDSSLVASIAFDKTYYGHLAPEELANAIEPILGHARACLVDRLKARMTSWIILLTGLDKTTDRCQRERGVYSFQDVAYYLARANVLNTIDRDVLQFRLDSEIRDLALDEFQDTSESQFTVIKPVIEELFSGQGSHDLPRRFLVVADPKQSIYGWRGGTPSLLGKLEHMGDERLNHGTLAKSYRSGPEVIDFVNMVFDDLKGNEALVSEAHPHVPIETYEACGLEAPSDEQTPVMRAIGNWKFQEHLTARTDLKGGILAWRFDPRARLDPDEKLNKEAVIGSMADEIVRVVKDRMTRSSTIGILLTTNDQVAEVVAALREAGIEASQEGGGALASYLVIQTILDLLRLAEHPDHRESAYRVSHSPLGELLGLPPLETIDPDHRSDVLGQVSRTVRRRIIDEGLEGFLISLSDDLLPHTDAEDRQAIRHCVDQAAVWNPSDVSRLEDFIRHIESISAGEPSGSPIRVMTMHSAKGLEFEEVILPLLDELMVKQSSGNGCMGWSPSTLDPPSFVVPELSKDLRPHVPLIEIAAQRQWELNLGDRLSLLYVSLTRACRVLNLVFAGSTKPANDKLTAGNIIRAAIPELDAAVMNGEEDERGRIWISADCDWNDEVLDESGSEPVPMGTRPIRVSLPKAEPAGAVAPSSSNEQQLRDQFRIWDTRARRRGVLIHEFFREIEWLEDGRPGKEHLERALIHASMGTSQRPGKAEWEEAVGVFESAMDDPAIARRLTRAAYEDRGCDRLEVLNEWPILDHVDGQLVRGRIDRMVIGWRGSEIAFIEIVDFKSGRLEDDAAAAESVEHYRSQIEFYVASVLAHYGSDVDPATVSGRLLFIEAGRDLPCTPCPDAPLSS